MKHQHSHPNHRRRERRGHGRGRHRARRGAVAQSALIVLDDGAKHGYDIIAELDERTNGAWKPSAGAMYPALSKLEERGLISGSDADDGKRHYSLTDEGRQRVAEMREAGDDTPWQDATSGKRGELRSAMAELVGPARQIGRFGTPEQIERAEAILKSATSELYQILADK